MTPDLTDEIVLLLHACLLVIDPRQAPALAQRMDTALRQACEHTPTKRCRWQLRRAE